jgi:hypothetical protein
MILKHHIIIYHHKIRQHNHNITTIMLVLGMVWCCVWCSSYSTILVASTSTRSTNGEDFLPSPTTPVFLTTWNHSVIASVIVILGVIVGSSRKVVQWSGLLSGPRDGMKCHHSLVRVVILVVL